MSQLEFPQSQCSSSLKEFADAIQFSFCQPSNENKKYCLQNPSFLKTEDSLTQEYNLSLELLNTIIPKDQEKYKQRLSTLLSIPKMSSYALAVLLNKAVEEMPSSECFLNIGTWNGFSLLSAMSGNNEKTCIGVDNFSEFDGPEKAFMQRFEDQKSINHHFHKMDYQEYFKNIHTRSIGCYFYDGEHSYKNQLQGLVLAEPYLSENSLIFVDDTNWEEPREATLDFIQQSSHNYEVIFDQTTAYPAHITFWNGLMILEKKS